jgi:hypothetical protein
VSGTECYTVPRCGRLAQSGGHTFRRPSPAAFAPFVDVGFLLAQGRVVAVAWVEPGVVGEDVEEPGGDVIDQRREVLRGGGAPHAAGEQSITSAVKKTVAWSHAGEGGCLRADLRRCARPGEGC